MWLRSAVGRHWALSAVSVGAVLALSGCSHTLGYAGKHPGVIVCAGKGSITVTGSAAVGAGYGGGQSANGTIQADCGDSGFKFIQGPAETILKLINEGVIR